MLKPLRWVGAAGLVLLSVGHGWAQEKAAPPKWADTPVTRLEALALIETLNADLLSSDSATLTLDRWCQSHHLASPAKITADQDLSAHKPATDNQRTLLGVADGEPVKYRRVRLRCGDHVLSHADNWYVPGRLTPEMNSQLEGSTISFGRLLQQLHFQRHTLAVDMLWRPLPGNWEVGGRVPSGPDANLTVPGDILQHTALLTLPDGRPISEVIETYTSEILAFPQPGIQ